MEKGIMGLKFGGREIKMITEKTRYKLHKNM